MSSPKCFDKNEEAVNLLENVKGSIENKIRTSFNLGYWQGWRDGQREAVQMLERTLMDMTTADRKTDNSSEKPNNCKDCKWSMQNCHDMEVCCEDETGMCVGYEPKDEPQTEDIPMEYFENGGI